MIFKAKKEKLYSEEAGFYTSYGVEVFSNDSENRLWFISDVFLEKEQADEFIGLMNECQPDIVHLEELCIDFIQ